MPAKKLQGYTVPGNMLLVNKMNRDWKKHKYFVKIKQGKNDRYFYSKEEYDSFKENVNSQKTAAYDLGSTVTTIVGRAMDNSGILPVSETNKNSKESSWKQKGYKSYREYKKAIISGKESIPIKKEKTNIEDDLNKINPSYSYLDYESQTNCAYCTLAFDMRRRGYDVVAEDEVSIDNEHTIKEWYKEQRDYTEIKGNWKFRDLKESLSEYPDDSYGQFCVYWKGGGGHSMIWYKEDGEIYIYDAQSYNYETKVQNEQLDHLNVKEDQRSNFVKQRKQLQTLDTWEHLNSDKVSNVLYLRTDDLTLSKKALKKVDYN